VLASSFASGLAHMYRRSPFRRSLARFSVLPAGLIGLGVAGLILGPVADPDVSRIWALVCLIIRISFFVAVGFLGAWLLGRRPRGRTGRGRA
jgi:hypothetical protein